MIDQTLSIVFALTLGADAAGADPGAIERGGKLMLLIPGLPALSTLLCGLYWALGVKSKLPAWTTVASLGASFVLAVVMYIQVAAPGVTQIVHGFDWITFSFSNSRGEPTELIGAFSLYLDSLTVLWMLFVTGLAALIALYASEYMDHDVGPGYCRFFFAFSLFVLAMACLVMADNLLLLFLGWEGVGLCSYLLIGYFFTKPSAVAAAKKAFIMNRIGDFGLLLGIFFAFLHFGSLEYVEIFSQVERAKETGAELPWGVKAIPYLLMVGAFGKSAQLPLYTWLPDAMEGPTPVSALIHAATMVTAGVYLIARMYPVFTLAPGALEIVAWVGGLTALLAATIGMAQFDIKRIMAYSTVSQLGYMFLGLGVLTSAGAAFHVFTHAFFKATLFLCCGAVMHGFAGQLDLRKLSGLWKMDGWFITSAAMLIGCVNLAGLPFTAGYFSKDMIIAEAFVTPGYQALGWIALITAGVTAYYTFRVFFRVFVGPKHFEPGDDHHGADADAQAGDEDSSGSTGAHTEFHPHAPRWAINAVLVVLAVGSILAAFVYFIDKENHGWVGGLVHDSTAYYESPYAAHDGEHASGGEQAPGTFLGYDPHTVMYYVSAVFALVGIAIAFVLHYLGRTEAATSRADALKARLGWLGRAAERKWYVDEIYDFLFRIPLLVVSHIFYLFDKLIIDGLVDAAGLAPRAMGSGLRPSQNGVLQSYAVGMAGGLALLLLIAWVVM